MAPGREGIEEFLQGIASGGGIAFSNTYEVDFKISSNEPLAAALRRAGFGIFSRKGGTAYDNLTMMCEEASLPGIMANTGNTIGKFQGEGQVNYAVNKMYQDITLSWISDANLSPLKFLNAWMGLIFVDPTPERFNSRTRLNYPDTYQCDFTIKKGERNGNYVLGREYGIYTMYDAWPYSVQSTPMAYGSSQSLRISASFYYRNWKFEGKI